MAVYEYKTEIRYSEIDSDGTLSLTALLDLFQNCTLFHSEAIGIGVDYLKEKHRAWVLTSWQVKLYKLPGFGQKVNVKTWSYGIKYTIGYRNFVLETDDGEVLCAANTLWAYVDTNTLAPTRCPADEADKYGICPPYPLEPAPRKIAVPDSLTPAESFDVKYYFIDTNNHMNNSKYVQAAMEYLPEGFTVDELRVEYKKSALLHETIHSYIGQADGNFYVVMKDDDGNIYATVEFIGK